jgi:hypothetical protein
MSDLYEKLGPLCHEYLRFRSETRPKVYWNGIGIPPGLWRAEWTEGDRRVCTGGDSPARALRGAFQKWRGVGTEEVTIPLEDCAWQPV